MEIEQFEKLLKEPECSYIDFKRDIYDFPSESKDVRCEFVKDVICMWNTPRQGDAYIVFGVDKHPDGSFELCGISKSLDDNDFQQKLDAQVNPKPDVRYEPIYNYQEKNFGVLVIPVNKDLGTCFPQKNCKGLIKDKLYSRLSSQNSEVVDYKRIQWIMNWFDNKGSIEFDSSQEFELWDSFCESMGNFSPDYYYMLVVSKFTSSLSNLPFIGLIDWLFVVDFDEDSNSDGLLSKCRTKLEERKTLHLVVKGESPTIHVNQSRYWYFGNGMVGRDDSLIDCTSDKQWQRNYSPDIEKQVERVASSISNSKPLKVLIVIDIANSGFSKRLREVLRAVNLKFEDSFTATVVRSVQDQDSELEKIASEYDAKFLCFPSLNQLLNGFLQFAPQSVDTESFVLPSRSGTPVTILSNDLLWLQEELEVVHRESGHGENAKNVSSLDYLKGQDISWENLRFNHDAKRNLTAKLQKRIKDDLRKHSTLRVNLYHIPGSGGTTIAKRVIWELHETHPCLVLKGCANPKETSARLSAIAKLCDNPLLLLVDSGLISDRESDALYNELAASHLSIVILTVLRTFENRSDKKDFFLNETLGEGESDYFYNALTTIKPDKKERLEKALKEKNITPFSLCLSTFENEYRGIDNYVISRLATLQTEAQKDILVFLAIAYFYGQEKIAAQWFQQQLNVPSSKPVTSEHLKNLPAFSQLIIEDSGYWRMAHQIFAERCLRLLLPLAWNNSQQLAETELKNFIHSEEWKHHLSDYAKNFAEFCHNRLPSVCDMTKSLIYKVFYNRENSEVLGSESAGNNRFARLIEDIPSNEGKLGILRYLAERYSEEAHVWAHLGRFYSVEMKEFDKAIESIDKALQIKDGDFLIHHMKGMAIRSKVYDLINRRGELKEIIKFANQASDSFAKARQINHENDYGYISEVQLIIRVLDHVGTLNGDGNAIYVIQETNEPWLRESVEKASDLLFQVRQNRRGNKSSEYEEKCQAGLDTICQRSGNAIEKWENLLSRKNLSNADISSIRRSLVWTHLYSVNRNWESLDQRKIGRIATLLKDNLKSDSRNYKNLRLWLQASRYLEASPPLEEIIEQVAYWRQQNNSRDIDNSLESVYYLYTLYCIQGFEGSMTGAEQAKQLMKECQERSRFQRKNEFSFEWLGKGTGFKQLLHESVLGEWDRDERIWKEPSRSRLMEVEGTISSLEGPTAGHIELKMGLKAFFVPAQSGHAKGKDENRKVECYIGFSYSGLRAWRVSNKD